MTTTAEAVTSAAEAFERLRSVDDSSVSEFFSVGADLLLEHWPEISAVNRHDIDKARSAGRHSSRLDATEKMRDSMVSGLRYWAAAPSRVGEIVSTVQRDGYRIERRRAPLGVVAFVFEGRPNVLVDGCGVLRGRNTAVMRIGSDALETAKAVMQLAVRPALERAGLPLSAVTLIEDASHVAAELLFSNSQVRLAIARGSGAVTRHLGDIATAHGIPVSLHGAGGAWMYVCADAPPERVANAIEFSLDRKVCNTLNVLLFEQQPMHEALEVLDRLGAVVHRDADLSHEYEWSDVPEISVAVVSSDDEAVARFNEHSPRLVLSILTSDTSRFDRLYDLVEAPYVGNGFTRWVDGQYAFDKPELGLANWERGRLFGRSGILTGEDVYTIRDVFLDLTGEATQRR